MRTAMFLLLSWVLCAASSAAELSGPKAKAWLDAFDGASVSPVYVEPKVRFYALERLEVLRYEEKIETPFLTRDFPRREPTAEELKNTEPLLRFLVMKWLKDAKVVVCEEAEEQCSRTIRIHFGYYVQRNGHHGIFMALEGTQVTADGTSILWKRNVHPGIALSAIALHTVRQFLELDSARGATGGTPPTGTADAIGATR